MIVDYNHTWMLGDDYDCDTCGYTYNSLRLEEFDDDLWCLTMSVGCYGGESTMSNDENFAVEANKIIDECLTYEYFSESDAEYARKLIRELSDPEYNPYIITLSNEDYDHLRKALDEE